jgi:hypothetical protein
VADTSKNRLQSLTQRSWSKQAKVSNGVSIALENVLRPTINEFFKRTLDLNNPP